MCGRFVNALHLFPTAIRFNARLTVAEDSWQPTWNAVPTQLLPVVIQATGENRLGLMRWGWPMGFKPGIHVNAIGETADKLPTFAESFTNRRCVVPATGFYEWPPNGGCPVYFETKDSIGLGAIWKFFDIDGHKQARFILLTCHPCEVVRHVHYRSPTILRPAGSAQAWLNPGSGTQTIKELMEASMAEGLSSRPISRRVNKAGVDGPELLKEVSSAEAATGPIVEHEGFPEL